MITQEQLDLIQDRLAFAPQPPEPEITPVWLNRACWIALVAISVAGAWACGNPVGWLL